MQLVPDRCVLSVRCSDVFRRGPSRDPTVTARAVAANASAVDRSGNFTCCGEHRFLLQKLVRLDFLPPWLFLEIDILPCAVLHDEAGVVEFFDRPGGGKRRVFVCLVLSLLRLCLSQIISLVNGGSDMRTLILAWVIGLLGLIMIGGGVWGVFDLFKQTARAPLRSYGSAISMICGGVAMVGLARVLYLLLLLFAIAAAPIVR